jgi:CheY-like chemotaxis protein
VYFTARFVAEADITEKSLNMPTTGPIVIIDDDNENKDTLESILLDIGQHSRVEWFATGDSAFDYLKATKEEIFLIFCELKLPGKDGLELKRLMDLDPELRKKSIPFIFYTTHATQNDVNEAFTEMHAQGFFKKGNNYQKMRELIKTIIDYWNESRHPF